jgi:hypothetical protein
MRGCSLAFTLVALLLVCAGCDLGRSATMQGGTSSAPPPFAPPTSGTVQGTVQDYATLVTALTAAGAAVQLGRELPPGDIFGAPSRDILVNGRAHMSVFEYPTAAAAADVAACFHGGQKRCPGERSDTIIDYVAPPHLYLAGRVLVLYTGAAASMLELLASVLGPPVDEGHWG